MTRAVAQLGVAPELIYVDGNKCPSFNCQAKALVKGDSRIASIAAASVLAKVTRDREMEQLDQEFPGYGLAQHKGYPTQDHMAALRELDRAGCTVNRSVRLLSCLNSRARLSINRQSG